jgi:predicted RND superfamily exporter protein
LTIGSIAALPVLFGVGMDSIPLHSRVEEEVVLGRAAHPIQTAVRNLGPALLGVTFDAAFAFLALTVAKVPMIRQFGWPLVVGIITLCAARIILPIAVLGFDSDPDAPHRRGPRTPRGGPGRSLRGPRPHRGVHRSTVTIHVPV